MAIPLFVFPAYRTTNLSLILDASSLLREDNQPLRIHWSIGFAGLVGVYLFVQHVFRKRLSLPPRVGIVTALMLTFLIALLWGLWLDARLLSVIYFFQTTAPLLGFFVGAHLARSLQTLRRTFLILVAASTFSILCILLLALLQGALSQDKIAAYRLARMVPQVREYFPFIVATSLSLALNLSRTSGTRRERMALAAAMAVHVAFYAVSWSRMGILMLAIVLLSAAVLGRQPGSRGRYARPALAMVMLLAAIMASFQFSALTARLREGHLLRSDSRRIQYALEALRVIEEKPLFGMGFRPTWYRDPFPERDLRIPRIFKAHNQYLDLAVRAGIPALAILCLIVWIVARDLRSVLRHPQVSVDERFLAVGIAGALLAVAVGNSTQLFLIQAQTGSLAWVLVGASSAIRQRAISRADSLVEGSSGWAESDRAAKVSVVPNSSY